MIPMIKTIIAERERFFDAINKYITPIYRMISGKNSEISITYRKCSEIEFVEEELKKSKERDYYYHYATYGPHHDDYSFLMDGSMMLSDFLEYIEEEDEELEDHITTVGGWATEVLGDYPDEGQSFQYRSYVVTIQESDEFRVTRLHVQRVPQDETTEDEE